MPEIPVFLMSNVVSDLAQTEGILQNDSCNDQGSVIAREVKVIALTSEPSIPARIWPGIQASRGLDSSGYSQTDFTERANRAEREKLSAVGCSSLQARIKRPLDIDVQPNSSRPESPVFGTYSDLQLPDCEITDGGKDHGKVSAWGAKIGSVLAIPMRRIDSRKKSIDSRKSAQSGLDTLGRERNSSKAQPDLCPGEHNISMGGVRSLSLTHTSVEEALHDERPSSRGETHYPAFQNIRGGGFGSSAGSSHHSPPAQSQSRMRQSFSKYSDKIATWGVPPGIDSDHRCGPFASRKFSLSDPPKTFKSRLNRFLWPNQGNDTEDRVLANALHDEGPDIPPDASHIATLNTSTNSEQLHPTKSGLKGNLARGINSARKRMSLPFIFGSDVAVACSPVEALGSCVVPLGPPRRMGVTPSALPGHSFLPPEPTSVTVSSTPPYLEHNHVTQEWTPRDLRDMNIIQSSSLDFPRYEDSPPQTPPHIIPIAPGINVVAPFESKEYIPGVEAGGDTPKASGVSRDIHHENSYPGDPKGGQKPSSDTNELDASAVLQGISPLPGGKPIELLEEEERRNKRDSRVMGLNPETIPGDDRLAGQADEDGRRDTYGAAIREIAGLDLTLRGPPALHSNNLGDVSGPSRNVNNFPSPVLQLGSNDEPAVTFPVTPPADSSESEAMAVTRIQPYNLFPRSGVTPASNTLIAQFTITQALTAVPAIFTPSQSQHLLMPRGISSSFIMEELSSRAYVKVAPRQMVAPVTASLSSRVPSSPETPLLSNGTGFDDGSPVSVSINGSGGVGTSPYHLGEQTRRGEEEKHEQRREQENEDINVCNALQKANVG